MTGKNSGKHGVFEFLEYGHDPLKVRVNSSRSIQAELLWEIAGRHGKKTVAGGVPMSYPPRPAHDFPGFYLGDFLSPEQAADFTSDPALFAELEQVVGPYRPWSTTIHDGGNEAGVIDDLTAVPRPASEDRRVPHAALRVGPADFRPHGHGSPRAMSSGTSGT